MNNLRYIGKCLLITCQKERVLAVGDLHLGYEETLNRSGVSISRQMFDEIISDFNAIFKRAGKIDKIILLGDIKHDFGSISGQEWGDVLKIIEYFRSKGKELVIIKGNHDAILKPILDRVGLKARDYYILEDFCFAHGNKDFEALWDKKIKYLVVGHIHPAVRLVEGVKSEKYKCFLTGKFKGREMIVVPSFIDYNIGTDPREGGGDFLAWKVNFGNFNVKIVGENLEVLDFGQLKKIKT